MRIILIFVLIFSIFGVAAAQDDSDTARVRLVHLVTDGPVINVYIDGELFVFEGEPATLFPGTFTDYIPFEASTFSGAITPEGEPLESAILTSDFTVEAGHDYTVLVIGSAAAGNVQYVTIDETALLADVEFQGNSAAIPINGLTGPEALTYALNDEVIVEALPFGEFSLSVEEAFASLPLLVTDAASPTDVVFNFPVVGPAGTVTFFALVGNFPGQFQQDFFVWTLTEFRGELSIVEGGTIAVGDTVSVALENGSRANYALTLDADSSLDISLLATDAPSPTDPIVYVYDAEGNLVAENDEISFDDDGFDAALRALELPAGTYTIQAAAYNDVGGGNMELSVTASE